LKPLDDTIFDEAKKHLESRRNNGKIGSDTDKFYRWMEELIQSEYKKLFDL
jgi:hypothetical protein